MLVREAKPASITIRTNLSCLKPTALSFKDALNMQSLLPKKWQWKISLKNAHMKIKTHIKPASPISDNISSQSLWALLTTDPKYDVLYTENMLPNVARPVPNTGKSKTS